MSFKKWQNIPFKIIPEEDRVKYNGLAICRGGCNKMTVIVNTKYRMCGSCASRWRYHGHSCDVSNCDSVADGTIDVWTKQNKILCGSCKMAWSRMDFCVWEKFLESRHSFLLRPETFVKALEEGIISPIEKENRGKQSEVAECQHGKMKT